jgi:hypothetical protein
MQRRGAFYEMSSDVDDWMEECAVSSTVLSVSLINDQLLSQSGNTQFPTNLQSNTPPSIDHEEIDNDDITPQLPLIPRYLDSKDALIIDNIVKHSNPSTPSKNNDNMIPNKGMYIKHAILHDHHNLPLVEGAVGPLEDSDNEELIDKEVQCEVIQKEMILLDTLRALSHEPSLRKLQAGLDTEAMLLQEETKKYQYHQQAIRGPVTRSLTGRSAQIGKRTKRLSKQKKSLKQQHQQQRHKREKTSPTSQKLLKDWLFSHSTCPYPNEEEKEELCVKTHLTLQQLNNWFINARRRILPNYHKQKNK